MTGHHLEAGVLPALAEPHTTPAASTAVARLDAWLETMRCPGGYGGPVVHWWQQSLVYTGAGLDWRYEGIIAGYLLLWERTKDERWLAKAVRAGDDLVLGLLANGHFAASAFEINPATAGTPHEAACDAALLMLARSLREHGHAGWEAYQVCAARNLQSFYIDRLWSSDAQTFMDSPHDSAFVPNKVATACEAMFRLSEATRDARWAEQYAVPALKRLISYQVDGHGSLDGAIAQNGFGSRRIDKYFPLYIARCIPALLGGHQWTKDEKLLSAALRAMAFIIRWTRADGSFPTVIYCDGRANSSPSWIAPLGDVLRAVEALRSYGFTADLQTTRDRLLAGQDASGGIQTARGFANQAGGRPSDRPDLRDVLHVVGWCDKAFRYLASQAGPVIPAIESVPFTNECTFRGQAMWFEETPTILQVSRQGKLLYRWRKGEPWPEAAAPEFWLR